MKDSSGSIRTINVLLVDDHSMVLDTFSLFLRSEGGMQVETANDLPRAFSLVKTSVFDMILLDLNMPGMNGLEGLEKMVQMARPVPVAILTGAASSKVIEEIMDSGAAGLILKTSSASTMSAAIRFMSTGAQYLPPETRFQSHGNEKSALLEVLTEKERLVLQYLVDGKLNREIAGEIGIAETTVKMHVMSICRKFGVRNRTQAAVLARTIDFA